MGMKRFDIPRDQLKKLRSEGVKITKIAKLYKCTPQTIRNYLKEYGIYTKDKPLRESLVEPDVQGWDKPPKLTEDDIRFLKRYDLEEYNK